jgi:muramoyltetrapeptide carboxypeptidase
VPAKPLIDRDPLVATGRAVRTIAVFAPAGYESDPERLIRAERRLGADGRTVITALSDSRAGRFSGSDDERLQWLRAVIDDPSIDIAMALRGGYGATRLLPRIDFPAMAAGIRSVGKRFVGHSDFTAISLGLLATTGAISFAGPMAGSDFGGASVDAFTEGHFWRAMRESRVEVEFATPAIETVRVDGILWGGNLAMLCSLIGTPYMPVIDGGILFVEDINEQPYRIERMMIQLQQAGILDRQKLVLCGDFSGFRVTDYDNGYGLADALAHVRGTTSAPIVVGLPFGHGPQKLTLAVGARAVVDVSGGLCRLTQHWGLAAG